MASPNSVSPELQKPIRCAIYTRKSTASGLDKDFNSLDAQREACEAHVRSHAYEGWVVLSEPFDDGGYTGANTERPGFQKLMDWVRAGRIDVVVVYKVDRLSRSLVDFSQVLDHFSRMGIGFVSVTQQFSTTDPVGRLTMNMLMSFAGFEREMITERIRDKVRAARRKGQWTGGLAPLGYRSEKARLLVVDSEAEWVRQIFAWYLEGQSALRIAERLNEANLPLKSVQRPRANPWNKDLVLRILRNRLYLGEISCQGEFVSAIHSPLIDPESFERVQRKLDPLVRRAPGASRNPVYLVRGTLRCGQCGLLMTSASCHRHGRVYRYYRCARRDKAGRKGCPTVQLPAEALEAFVVERVKEVFADPSQKMGVMVQVAALGMNQPEDLSCLWDTLTLANRQRLIRLLVQEVRVDEFQQRVSVRFRDLAAIQGATSEEPSC